MRRHAVFSGSSGSQSVAATPAVQVESAAHREHKRKNNEAQRKSRAKKKACTEADKAKIKRVEDEIEALNPENEASEEEVAALKQQQQQPADVGRWAYTGPMPTGQAFRPP